MKKRNFWKLSALTLVLGLSAMMLGCEVGGGGDDTSPPPTQYTLTFNTLGGNGIASKTVNAGSSVDRPADPARADYTFNGWYTDETGSSQISFPLTLDSDTTVYARWILVGDPVPPQYTLMFNTLGGSEITSVMVNAGSSVNRPADPARADYTFNGWYTDENYGYQISFPLTLDSDTTVYARWTEKVPVPIQVVIPKV